jgi:pyruvate/2-oxoglutarate dehydrogenase complex dihydrolipoamide dehydrogenase (E3) component
MAQPEQFDIVVLGSGEAGKYLAWHMAHAGYRTAVVERKLIGGSCPNTKTCRSARESQRESRSSGSTIRGTRR